MKIEVKLILFVVGIGFLAGIADFLFNGNLFAGALILLFFAGCFFLRGLLLDPESPPEDKDQ